MAAEPTNRPMVVAEPQDSFVPPHIIARRSMKIPGMKMAQPMRSKSMIRWTAVRSRCMDGGLKKHSIASNVRAPGGRLTQKHHRQVAYCVNAPPMTGARIRPMAKQLLHIPSSTGFDFSGDTVRTITKPPLATPDAPIPAIARPAMKVLLFGAKPHTRLPIRNIEKNDT